MTIKPLVRFACVLALAWGHAACTRYFDTPTTPTPESNISLDTFQSEVTRGGSATRAVAVGGSGTLQATLTSVTPAVSMGLGIGIPRPDGSGCNLARSVESVPGAQAEVSATVDTGSYCVKVFDVGFVTERASFSVTIRHP